MKRFYKLSINAQEDAGSRKLPSSLAFAARSDRDLSESAREQLAGWNDETAARHYAESLFASSEEADLNELVAPERAELVPDLRMLDTKESPLTGTRRVDFTQMRDAVPIFGTRAVVEISGADRRFVSLDATLTEAPDVPPVASISPLEALRVIADLGGLPIEAVTSDGAPELQYFLEESSARWHLVYYLKNVNIAPPAAVADTHRGEGHMEGSPRVDFATYDYLVDAHDRQVVYSFSSSVQLEVPVPCRGMDDDGNSRQFYGLSSSTGGILLSDPLRGIDTYDLNFADITTPASSLPTVQIASTNTDFGISSTAGVAAHYYAMLVFDFFNHILKRNGIDDRGMRLVSMVNCTYSRHSPPPVWRNAVWWNNRMWYGQNHNGGTFSSYARHFDVIAHELTHGVTGTTSNLVYRDQSGALNESFSDIFGVIVKNWYPSQPNALATWNWEIGSGLGRSGGPLRDFSNPTATGDPDHMNAYVHTTDDNGGVHTNSNIHNKAAYNLLTTTDDSGAAHFTPDEVAILYYLTLTRLSRRADFADCLRVLKSVAGTYFQGDTTWPTRRRAIEKAYHDVGIM